jgi:hypothetical protein
MKKKKKKNKSKAEYEEQKQTNKQRFLIQVFVPANENDSLSL